MHIKFGTDGWRAIIAKEYTFDNLKLASLAAAKYFESHPNVNNGVCVGYDTRFMSEQFAHFVADVFSSLGLKVYLSDDFLPTPAVSLFVREKKLAGGVVITASHNPPLYSGFKVKADYGGSAHPEIVAEIESYLPVADPAYIVKKNSDLIELVDMKAFYNNYLCAELDIPAIVKSGFKIGHNAMFGAGQGIVSELLKGASVTDYHCSLNPTFDGINPEPIPRYTKDFREFMLAHKLDVGILNDGDADRIGMMDENGEFVDSHKIFAIILKYLVVDKKLDGEVAKTYALTEVIDKICAKYNIPIHTLPIGFKYVGKLMTTNNILMGGEESGGIGITSHLAERDGVYIGLLVLEIMAKKQMKLSELVQELYDEYGFFYYDRNDAHLTEAEKQLAMQRASKGEFKDIAGMKVVRFDDLDGYKYFFEGGWLLIRPSGTEPVLRLYSEADSKEKVDKALKFASELAK
ncbi:MAG: phosphoglucomutase/phosphomannomutase family protein [Chlorobiales bacterium]|nr:phosphoglucomutase/phosphomannomutase family protein [Chlorobiales bacterium]